MPDDTGRQSRSGGGVATRTAPVLAFGTRYAPPDPTPAPRPAAPRHEPVHGRHLVRRIAAFVLACLMVIVGLWAATDSLVREAAAERRDPKAFYIVPLSAMLVFATCTAFAFRNRFNPPAHKRLILIAHDLAVVQF